MSSPLLRYYSTLKYLLPSQIYHQLRHHLLPPRLTLRPSRVYDFSNFPVVGFPLRENSFSANNTFCFLNKTASFGREIDWSPPACSRLWQYNLHYFQFLLQHDLDFASGEALIFDWIAKNPPQRKVTAWEPYPTSLRIISWLKFYQRFAEEIPARVEESLSLQVENLINQLEYHIQGNHLFANGKAIWAAGICAQNPRWEEPGRKIVLDEIPRQFLCDGGHFELSPMYHALMLEDLLDLTNFLQKSPHDSDALFKIQGAAQKALAWLTRMADHQPEMPLLNDSALGISLPVSILEDYAWRLGLTADFSGIPLNRINGWDWSSLSGYQMLVKDEFNLIFDTSPLGPDYLPGHAHGDMLSILLSCRGRPILTDTGVFEYAEGAARRYSRSTGAHNTISVDDLDQGDFWKSFRLGARGHPSKVDSGSDWIASSHDGFIAQGVDVTHRRTIQLMGKNFLILDTLTGSGKHQFVSSFHFAPGISVVSPSPNCFRINDQLILEFNRKATLETSDFFPEYGTALKRPCLKLRGTFDQSLRLEVKCTFCS